MGNDLRDVRVHLRRPRTKVERPRTKSGVLGQKSDVLELKAGVLGQRSGVLGQGSGVLGQGSGVLGQGSGVLGQGSGVPGQRSGVPEQGLGVLGQRSGVFGQRSGVFSGQRCHIQTCDMGSWPEPVLPRLKPPKSGLSLQTGPGRKAQHDELEGTTPLQWRGKGPDSPPAPAGREAGVRGQRGARDQPGRVLPVAEGLLRERRQGLREHPPSPQLHRLPLPCRLRGHFLTPKTILFTVHFFEASPPPTYPTPTANASKPMPWCAKPNGSVTFRSRPNTPAPTSAPPSSGPCEASWMCPRNDSSAIPDAAGTATRV